MNANVCLVRVCLEQAIFIFPGHSTMRALREKPEINHSIKIRVIQLEPINTLPCLSTPPFL